MRNCRLHRLARATVDRAPMEPCRPCKHGDPRSVIADPRARYFGAELGERTLVPERPYLPSTDGSLETAGVK